MNRCSEFTKIVRVCAKYARSLTCLPVHRRMPDNVYVRSMFTSADCHSRTVINSSYISCVRALHSNASLAQRFISNKSDDTARIGKQESSPGLLRRFHQTYKQHGKILVCVHLVTSAVWGTMFFYAAVRGVDVVPILQWLGASERIITPFTKPGVGHAAVAYLLYKLATPLRYTVTIGGTHLSVKYLRRWGYLPPIASTDTIRSMVKTKIGEVRDQRSHRRRHRRRKH